MPRALLRLALLTLAAVAPLPALAQETTQFKQMVARGFDYLRETGQAEDGTFSARAGSGNTALAAQQREDGSWANSHRQWFENDPNLCTAFALLSLSYCEQAQPQP